MPDLPVNVVRLGLLVNLVVLGGPVQLAPKVPREILESSGSRVSPDSLELRVRLVK